MAVAGGLGAATRWSLDGWIRPRTSRQVPWSTFVINVSGSLLLGLLIGLCPGADWRTVLGTGFLGGYTTFSTASVEVVHLALDGRRGAAIGNAAAMLVLSVAAASVGYAIGT